MDVDDDRCSELEQRLREAQALLLETENKSDEVCTNIFTCKVKQIRLVLCLEAKSLIIFLLYLWEKYLVFL